MTTKFTVDSKIWRGSPVYRPGCDGQVVEDHGTSVLPSFYKRSSYAYEDEVRIALYNPAYRGAPGKVNRIRCNLNRLMHDIVIAPRANDAFASCIQAIVRSHLPRKSAERSRLQFDRKPSATCLRFMETWRTFQEVQREHRADPARFIVFSTINDFHTWAKEVNRLLGLPMLGRRAHVGSFAFDACGSYRWSTPIPHPDRRDPRVITVATKSISLGHPLLSQEDCRELGWFQTLPPM